MTERVRKDKSKRAESLPLLDVSGVRDATQTLVEIFTGSDELLATAQRLSSRVIELRKEWADWFMHAHESAAMIQHAELRAQVQATLKTLSATTRAKINAIAAEPEPEAPAQDGDDEIIDLDATPSVEFDQ